jgi:DNA-binding NtrC family response regulator
LDDSEKWVGLEFEETTGEGNRGRMMEKGNCQEALSTDPVSSWKHQSVLILNQTSGPCAGKCDALFGLLQRSLAVRCREEPCSHYFPDRVSSVPDLILLRLSGDAPAQKLVRSCKEKWPAVSILALLCARWDKLIPAASSVLINFDDFLTCPFQDSELLLRANRLLQTRQVARGTLRATEVRENLHFESLVGNSENFLKAVEKVPPLALSRVTVLISGETGTGKELFARAIHYQSPRHGKPFIPVNCGALPDHLFENELFGHVKGAFTDASSAEKGLIAEAEGGTLFLDEVDALSHAGQVKLLRFLQDGEYRPVGSARTVIADVRVIAATNTDLMKRVESKIFRDDLYYRLNFLSLAIPALRERIEDVVPLAAHFLDRYAKQDGREARIFSFGALEKLMAYSWPGNIRELESVITRSLTFSGATTLEPDDIELPSVNDEAISRARSLRDAKSRTVQAFERGYLAKLLAKYQGNVTHAAKAAGKERRTFQRLLRKHNLSRHSFTS